MTAIDVRPRSASEIIDASFNVLRQNYSSFITAAAIMFLPLLALSIISPSTISPTPADLFAAGFGAVFIKPALVLIWTSLTTAVMSVIASQIYLGKQVDVRAALMRILQRALPLLGVSVLLWLFMGIAFVFLFIPAFFVFARFAVSVTVAALEDTGVGESFGRASALSRNNRMHYFKTMLLVVILYVIASTTLGVIGAILASSAVVIVTSAIASIFLQPVIGVAQAVLYYDLRIRNEGYDLQLMAERLGTEQPASPAAIPI